MSVVNAGLSKWEIEAEGANVQNDTFGAEGTAHPTNDQLIRLSSIAFDGPTAAISIIEERRGFRRGFRRGRGRMGDSQCRPTDGWNGRRAAAATAATANRQLKCNGEN